MLRWAKLWVFIWLPPTWRAQIKKSYQSVCFLCRAIAIGGFVSTSRVSHLVCGGMVQGTDYHLMFYLTAFFGAVTLANIPRMFEVSWFTILYYFNTHGNKFSFFQSCIHINLIKVIFVLNILTLETHSFSHVHLRTEHVIERGKALRTSKHNQVISIS